MERKRKKIFSVVIAAMLLLSVSAVLVSVTADSGIFDHGKKSQLKKS